MIVSPKIEVYFGLYLTRASLQDYVIVNFQFQRPEHTL